MLSFVHICSKSSRNEPFQQFMDIWCPQFVVLHRFTLGISEALRNLPDERHSEPFESRLGDRYRKVRSRRDTRTVAVGQAESRGLRDQG